MTVTSVWEDRFRALTVDSFDVAGDLPDRGVVAAGGIEPHQLYAWDRSTGSLRRLTDAPGGILEGAISADGRWVYYLDDPGAGEEGVVVRMPFEGGPAEPLDPGQPGGALFGTAKHGPWFAFTIVTNGRFEHRIATSDAAGSRLVTTDESTANVANFADDGQTLVVARFLPDGGRETILLDVAGGSEVARLSAPGATLLAYTPSPIPDDPRFLAETNESGVRRPFFWNRDTDERMPIPVDGLDGEVRPIDWSLDGRLVLLLQVHRAEMRFHLYDVASGERRHLPTPPGAITGLPITFETAFVAADEILTLWQDGAHPRSILRIPVDGRPFAIEVGAPDPPAGHTWQNVGFASADGTPIQAWLATPDGDPPYPAIVDIHGGPGIVQFDEFWAHLQAFVDRGFAVISVNYRSSSTFGKAFEEAIHGHPGELEVEDIAAARDYLVAAGIADPERVLVEGWSYGGYLTLMSLSRRPDLWAGGICGVGIGDMAANHAEAAEFIRQMFTTVFGGTPDDVPDRYAEASPITHADRVRAPLLVVHGTDDIRCPPGQMRRYLDRMSELGKEVTVEWFTAGHLGGMADPGLMLEHTRLMLAFSDRVAGTASASAGDVLRDSKL